MSKRLTELQGRILGVLAEAEVEWTLSGGGALAGFYLGHRTTEDLDLFLHGRVDLDEAPAVLEGRLRAAGLSVQTLTRAPSFLRLAVEDGRDRVIVDVVAEPVPFVEAPLVIEGIRVDTPHEILVNKLCALVSRSELRDLEDVRALLAAGGDLERALNDAPRKDGGFSPMTLTWLLDQLSLRPAAELGFDVDRLERFRQELLRQLSESPPG